MKSLAILILSCLSVLGQHVLTTGSGIDWPRATVPLVTDWSTRVVANGGALPSQTSIIAGYNFLVGLTNDGLYSKMLAVNFFAPDSLIASITPVIVSTNHSFGSQDPWNNPAGFVLGDLSINGLTGNGSSKYLKTGVSITDASSTSMGVTIYSYTRATSANPFEMGAQNQPSVSVVALLTKYNDTHSYYECFNFSVGGGLVDGGVSPGNGYYSGNRTAANAAALYFASSTSPHAALATIATTGGTPPNLEFFCFCLNLANPTVAPADFSNATISFAAIHLGLTSAESSNFYNRIQTLRTALGGGFR